LGGEEEGNREEEAGLNRIVRGLVLGKPKVRNGEKPFGESKIIR